MNRVLYIVGVICLMSLSLKAQDVKKIIKEGNDNLEYDHFRKASKSFEKVIEIEPQNAEALFSLGRAYIGSYRHQEGLEKMEEALLIKQDIDKHQEYWLGRANHLNYYFDKAIAHYQNYSKTIKSSKDSRKSDLEKFIRECNFGKDFFSVQSNYRIENIGEPINSTDIEHSPIVTQDGKTMMFTSRHYFENGTGENADDEFKEQIKISTKGEDGRWSKPVDYAHNKNGHDATVQLFDGDSKLLLYRNSNAGDLYISEFNGESWLEPEPFNELNTQWTETDAYISADGKSVVFSSSFQSNNHDGTSDLYIMNMDGAGKWSTPVSIGANINTKYNESAPFISTDGKTLFFSSTGHSSMGGYDVFKSTYDEANDAWSDPVNLGYPLNTPGDDIYFYYSNENNWSGYFSSYRRDGLGEKDIYEVTFVPNVDVNGLITDKETGEPAVNVTVEFIANGEEGAMASIETENGNYTVNVLADNNYSVLIKNSENQTLATFDYGIPELKENDPLEYVFNMEISTSTPELISENRHEATIADEEPVSIAVNEVIENELNSDETSSVYSGDNTVNETDEHYESGTNYIAENNSQSKGGQLIQETLEELSSSTNNVESTESKQVGAVNFVDDKKIAVKEYFKMNDVETGCKRVLHHVYFDFNKAILQEKSYEELSKLSCLMSTVPNIKVEIGGYTDNVGDDAYNKSLSKSRAQAVVRYLIKQGVSQDRLKAVGYGEECPLASNDDEEEGRELNRRTEFKIISTGLSLAY